MPVKVESKYGTILSVETTKEDLALAKSYFKEGWLRGTVMAYRENGLPFGFISLDEIFIIPEE